MIINLIVAVDNVLGIGSCNSMPWGRIKEDMHFFRETTINKVVIMGRNTYISIGGEPLKNRTNIVLTTQDSFDTESVQTYASACLRQDEKVDNKTTLIYKNSLENAFNYAKEIGETEVFIIGGRKVYLDTIENASTIYMTHIANNYGCDIHFPQFDETNFLKEEIKSFMYEGIDVSIFKYSRDIK